MRAIQLNNQALQASCSGDFKTAEQLHLEAISLKETSLGTNNPTTGLTYNALGELYLKMGRLDEAEVFLSKAIQVRNTSGPPFDAAVSRENMAQLYELRGNLANAKKIRLMGIPNKLVCGYYQVGVLYKFIWGTLANQNPVPRSAIRFKRINAV
uniref:Tetratricopeptide repeat protein n=1 Tax=Psilocybe cubensis TaxID=181762 RepID=A0A8H8CQV9_PSICU